jgi:hypothetical protein
LRIPQAWSFWDSFYGKHENKFYRDRHWLLTEFPEFLSSSSSSSAGPVARNSGGDSVNAVAAPAVVSVDAEQNERWQYSSHSSHRVLECGCGAGNTVFPLLEANQDPAFFVCVHLPTRSHHTSHCAFSARVFSAVLENFLSEFGFTMFSLPK